MDSFTVLINLVHCDATVQESHRSDSVHCRRQQFGIDHAKLVARQVQLFQAPLLACHLQQLRHLVNVEASIGKVKPLGPGENFSKEPWFDAREWKV